MGEAGRQGVFSLYDTVYRQRRQEEQTRFPPCCQGSSTRSRLKRHRNDRLHLLGVTFSSFTHLLQNICDIIDPARVAPPGLRHRFARPALPLANLVGQLSPRKYEPRFLCPSPSPHVRDREFVSPDSTCARDNNARPVVVRLRTRGTNGKAPRPLSLFTAICSGSTTAVV